MGGLFYTGQSRRTSGSFTVTCSGAKDIVKRLNKLENGGQTAFYPYGKNLRRRSAYE